MSTIKSRYFWTLIILVTVFTIPAHCQTAPGSDIVSKTLLSSDGTRMAEQRVYDNGNITVDSLGTPHYHYYVCDHLGSVRAVVGEAGTVEHQYGYYPFGALHSKVSAGTVLCDHFFQRKFWC